MINSKTTHIRTACTSAWTTSSRRRRTSRSPSGSARLRQSEGVRAAPRRRRSHCEIFHADDDAYWEDVWYWQTPRSRVRRRRRTPRCKDFDALGRGLDGDQGLIATSPIATAARTPRGIRAAYRPRADRRRCDQRRPGHRGRTRPTRADLASRCIAGRASSSALLLAAPARLARRSPISGRCSSCSSTPSGPATPFTRHGRDPRADARTTSEDSLTNPLYRTVTLRTVGMAVAVTLT